MDLAAALWFTRRIETEEKLDSFPPVSAVARRVEEAQIEGHMLAIIGGERLADRWFVQKRRRQMSHWTTIFASLSRHWLTLVLGVNMNEDDRRCFGVRLEGR